MGITYAVLLARGRIRRGCGAIVVEFVAVMAPAARVGERTRGEASRDSEERSDGNGDSGGSRPLARGDRERGRRCCRRRGAGVRLGVQQVDEERRHREARDGGGNVHDGPECRAGRARRGPRELHAEVEGEGVLRGPRGARRELIERDAVCLLRVAARDGERAALPEALQVGGERGGVEREAGGHRGDGRHDRALRDAGEPQVAHHELPASGKERECEHEVLERPHAGLRGEHAARQADGDVRHHDRPRGRKDLPPHAHLPLAVVAAVVLSASRAGRCMVRAARPQARGMGHLVTGSSHFGAAWVLASLHESLFVRGGRTCEMTFARLVQFALGVHLRAVSIPQLVQS